MALAIILEAMFWVALAGATLYYSRILLREWWHRSKVERRVKALRRSEAKARAGQWRI